MKVAAVALLLVSVVALVSATTYYKETFDGKWQSRWVKSTAKGADNGKVDVTAGKYFSDQDKEKGLRTTTDYRFYQYSSSFPEFSNRDKKLIFQFSVKNEQKLDCGGGYLKLLPSTTDLKKFSGDSDYYIMFGPDICGPGSHRVHAILNYKGTNHLLKNEVSCPTDEFTHVYTFVLNPDQTFQILVDGEEKRSGNIVDEWDLLPPKEIKDPSVSKPADWVDDKEIDDPEDEKPEGWDAIPEFISDPDAEKPEDWDEELDGEWEAPVVPNPEYKGEWSPRQIPNPAYKGPWVHPIIPNPEYSHDSEIYAYDSIGAVGLEIWQVKAGSIFANILVTDEESVAAEFREIALTAQAAEKEQSEAEAEAQRKKDEADRAKLDDQSEDDEEDEDEDEEEDDGHDHGAHDEL
jgi:calreticulin